MTLPFERVWVTGASAGIGRATCLELAAQGAHVAATARSADKLDSLVAEATRLPGSITAFPGDITDSERMRAVVAEISDQLGPLDVALLNAGTYLPLTLDDWTNEAFAETYRLNVQGTVHCISAVLPGFKDRGEGHIAIVSSIAGVKGLPTSAAYGSSKAAVTHMAEAMRCEQAATGIKVQVILPGFVKTPLTDKNEFPMPFLIPAEKAAKRIVSGLQSSRFEITFPKRFTWLVKATAALPDFIYFPIIGRVTGASR
ncbi:MAG: SDR family NAD(P)-dependent oxidoreductase [Alphaproteobacteria bacterium]